MRRQVWLIVGGFMSILYGFAILGALTMISYGGFWRMSFPVRATAVGIVGAVVLGGVVLVALGCYQLLCEQPDHVGPYRGSASLPIGARTPGSRTIGLRSEP